MVGSTGKRVDVIAAMSSAALMASVAVAAWDRTEELVDNALQVDADAMRGEALYRDQCASCHGPNAYGAAEHDIPALAAQRRAYIVKQLADFLAGDRRATQMHRVVSRTAVSNPQALADVSLYLNRLPPPAFADTGDGKYLALGAASYAKFCGGCHQDDGRGDDDGFVPSVRNQHYRYLLKEMRNLADGHRLNVEHELSRFLESLPPEEMQGLADYLSRMQGPLPDRTRDDDTGSDSR